MSGINTQLLKDAQLRCAMGFWEGAFQALVDDGWMIQVNVAASKMGQYSCNITHKSEVYEDTDTPVFGDWYAKSIGAALLGAIESVLDEDYADESGYQRRRNREKARA